MTEDMFVIGGFFVTVIIIVIGLPLVRSYIRRGIALAGHLMSPTTAHRTD